MTYRLLVLAALAALGVGAGWAIDGEGIRTTGDAFWAALKFPVIGLAAYLGPWIAAKAGLRRKESGPRSYQAAAWLLVAVTVASLAWLVIDLDASGWRRAGLGLVVAGGAVATVIFARAGALTGRREQRPRVP